MSTEAVHLPRHPHRGPDRLILQLAPRGAPRGFDGRERCAPTSLAMIARAYGVGPKLSDAALVQYIDGLDGKQNEYTSAGDISDAARKLGFDAYANTSFNEALLNRELGQRHHIIVTGDPWVLSRSLDSAHQYSPGTSHAIVVIGHSRSGYLVQDPMVPRPYRVSAEQLHDFALHGNGRFIYVKPAGR